MSTTIFCSNCGNQLEYNRSKCECGFEMTLAEKKEINNKFITIKENVLIDSQLKTITNLSNQELLDNYLLEKKYYKSSTAKRDYEEKVRFFKSDLRPKVNNWSKSIQEAEKIVAKDKVEVFGKIISITDFVLKEFFGPFTIKENGLQPFNEFRDFSKYELTETMINANLDFSDIKTVSFSSIGTNVMSSVESTLKHGTFKELSKKTMWSKSDYKTVKTEIGIAIAGELITGISNMIGQNSEAIKAVREADEKLNKHLKQTSNVINSLAIEEKEIEKQKKLYDKSEVILDTCFEKILKPIIDELNTDTVYLNYRKEREPFDYEQELIRLDKEVLNTKVKIYFWSCLLKNKQQNHLSNWKKRIAKIGKLERYKELTSLLKIEIHTSLDTVINFEKLHKEKFKEFEKENRKKLKTIPAIAKNAADVIKFAGVLKQVKTNITS